LLNQKIRKKQPKEPLGTAVQDFWAIFPGKPGLAGFIGAKDIGNGGDNWCYKTCKATRVGKFYPHAVLTMVKTPVKTGLGKTPKTHMSWAILGKLIF